MKKKQRKNKIYYSESESDRSYIRVYGRRYYLDDFMNQRSDDGRDVWYHAHSFTNCGYYAGFRIVGIEYGINDYAITEEV